MAGVVLGVMVCSLGFVRGQELGECTKQVLSAPTESSVKVRVTGVNEWPMNPICFWSAEGLRADGNTYRWSATLIGDGLVENPEPSSSYVNVTVSLRYQVRSGSQVLGSRSLVLNCFCPYPSDGFNMLVISDPALRTPPEGDTASWGGDEFGDTEGFPSLSFQGYIRLDAANNLTVDILFTGGPLPPTISDLTFLVNGSGLTDQEKHPLLVALEGASDALSNGDCKRGIKQLKSFQNKVRAQVADETLAAALIATAQGVIDTACSE
jgi:hypothetical protein